MFLTILIGCGITWVIVRISSGEWIFWKDPNMDSDRLKRLGL